MCACDTGLDDRGASVLAFVGEQIALVVVWGGCSVSSGEGRLVGCVDGIDGMFIWVGSLASRGDLVGLAGVGPSV